jgi:hypothetical protein
MVSIPLDSAVDGHTRVATTRTNLLDDDRYGPGLLLADCSCGGTYTVPEGGVDEFAALEREHVRHVARKCSEHADATCADGRAVDVEDGQMPGGGSYASCPSCGYRGETGSGIYAVNDARRHNAAAKTRAAAAEVPDAACEGCGGSVTVGTDNDKCDECMATSVCEECGADVGSIEIADNGGKCGDCASGYGAP